MTKITAIPSTRDWSYEPTTGSISYDTPLGPVWLSTSCDDERNLDRPGYGEREPRYYTTTLYLVNDLIIFGKTYTQPTVTFRHTTGQMELPRGSARNLTPSANGFLLDAVRPFFLRYVEEQGGLVQVQRIARNRSRENLAGTLERKAADLLMQADKYRRAAEYRVMNYRTGEHDEYPLPHGELMHAAALEDPGEEGEG